MSDEQHAGESGANPAGGSAAGSSAGGGLEGYVPRAELDQTEARRRALQAERDRAQARIAELESQITSAQQAPPQPSPTFDPKAVVAELRAEMRREMAMEKARAELSEKFPLARPELLGAEYETPEEFRAAVEASHSEAQSIRDAMRSEIEAEYRQQIKEKHGIDLPSPAAPPSDGEGGSRQLTAADLASMSFAEFNALSDEQIAAAKAR